MLDIHHLRDYYVQGTQPPACAPPSQGGSASLRRTQLYVEFVFLEGGLTPDPALENTKGCSEPPTSYKTV